MTRDFVTANVDRPLARLGVSKIDNLQFYWNSYGAPDYVKTTQYLAVSGPIQTPELPDRPKPSASLARSLNPQPSSRRWGGTPANCVV